MSLDASTAALEGTDEGANVRAAFARMAWGVLAYTFLVILFGAVVRITGSGAGCGQHWPTCQGDIAHLPRSTATAIEYAHRVTSGLSGLLVLGLGVLAFRRFPANHGVRRAAALALVFMVLEAYIGRQLVVLNLVGKDVSVMRAVVMGAHLMNTSFLMGALALTAWSSWPPRMESADAEHPHAALRESRLPWALGAVLVVSVTGALTALGDTLYPHDSARSIAEHVVADQSPVASFMERGRAVHPIAAVAAAIVVLVIAGRAAARRPVPPIERLSILVQTLVYLQLAAGVANVLLRAPGYMQVLHLALATGLWVALVLLCAAVVDDRGAAPS